MCWKEIVKFYQMKMNHTGAMYSSVPTNEFDCVTGSATKVGSG